MFAFRVFISSLLIQSLSFPLHAEQLFASKNTPCCLPSDVKPAAYRVQLMPDVAGLLNLDNKGDIKFKGEEEADVELLRPADGFRLNSAGLVFDRDDVTLDGEKAKSVIFDVERQTATIAFAHAFPAGKHQLHILYSGQIVPQAHGIYYADYDTPQGKRRMLITQFEATDARRMFPCWDEPVFKASIELTVELPDSFRAVSNMPIAREEPAGAGKKKVAFAASPKMSTYLAALVAGEIEKIAAKAGSVDIGVYAPKGREQLGAYARDTAVKLLLYYNDYFGVTYPLPKLDLVAIPNFAATAMENWGAITYIDNSLLFDPKDSTQATKHLVFEVIAHEMAHQWSGNLVTMAWWDDLWLNEGFASWMQKKSTDYFNPAWKVWLRAHAAKEQAMRADARSTTHAIQQPIMDDSKIYTAFDSISYGKGEAILRMLESYIGEDRFREGMRLYMKEHAYSSATTADLWAALAEASQVPIAAIAKGFTEHPGVPLIHVETACVDGATSVVLTQDRFSVHNLHTEQRVWQVPVTVGRIGDAKPRAVLVGDEPKQIKFPGCGEAVKANFGDTGYYRVEYAPADFKTLAGAWDQLSEVDRLNLLSDSWAMVQAGRAGPGVYLGLTRPLSHETEYAVWAQIIDVLGEIDDLERGSEDREAFRAYARELLKPVLDRLGWEPKPDEANAAPLDLLLRNMVITALGRFADKVVIAESQKRFATFLNAPEKLHPEVRDAVSTVVGHVANRKTFDELHDLARRATGSEAKFRYFFALAGAHDPALIEEVFNIALTDEIPSGRVIRYLAAAAGSNDNADRIWELVAQNRDAIVKKLTAGQKQKFLPAIASKSSNPAIAFELKWKMRDAGSTLGARYEVDKAVEEIEYKADFKQRLLPSVDEWIKTH